MTNLPELPNTKRKLRRQVTAFLGLNRTDNNQEGELADSYGVSCAGYPFLTQRDPQEEVEGYSAPTDLFEWDGKLVVVDGGILHYDGNPLVNVSEGRKQFAVVNTKLCVFPDKIVVDVENGTYGRLDAAITTLDEENGVVVTHNSFSAVLTAKKASNLYFVGFTMDSIITTDSMVPVMYVYGQDREALEACWDAANNEWVGLSAIESRKNDTFAVGDILIPQVAEGAYEPVYDMEKAGQGTGQPDRSLYNTQGFYCVISSISDVSQSAKRTYRIWVDVYRAGVGNTLFSDVFSVGDVVTITGTTGGAYDVEKRKILAIDDGTNTLTFPDNTFAGSATLTCEAVIQRAIPDLDFIAQSGNRLWGVSNQERTIYASALGLPTVFFDYGGTATDAYAVAVGSEGDFTAVCAYDSGVLCWKENRLHKVLGSYPAEYYIAEYTMPGVMRGCERSAQVMNEVLYYKAQDGVYAYSGSAPVLISQNLGRERMTDGVGGTLDNRYYLSVKDSGGDPMILVYDTRTGLWMKEQEVYADAYALVSGALYHLTDGALYRTAAGGSEVIEWMAEFVPFTESAYMRKGYSKLYLRFDMTAGSWLKVEIRPDEKPWRRVYTQSATLDVTRSIPIHLGYCDRFSVRIRGKGKAAIRSLTREFIVGSD